MLFYVVVGLIAFSVLGTPSSSSSSSGGATKLPPAKDQQKDSPALGKTAQDVAQAVEDIYALAAKNSNAPPEE